MADQAMSIGLVVRRDHDGGPVADAIVRAISGPLIAAGLRFITRSVSDEESELRTYRLWARVGGIAGVILLGVSDEDARVRLLRQIDMPFAALAPTSADVDYPAVVIESTAAAEALVEYLGADRPGRWVYVTDQQDPEPFRAHDDANGPPIAIVRTEDVVRESVHVVGERQSATTLVVDDDVDAVLLLSALEADGLAVPGDVALVCWSDSLICQSASRPITAIDRRGREIGALLGAAAIAAVHGDDFGIVMAPAPRVVVRETA